MALCDLRVVLFLKDCWRARARSRAGGFWSWWPSSTWPCCWAAPSSSTSRWASFWLSRWFRWRPSSRRTSQSESPVLFFPLHTCFSAPAETPPFFFTFQGPGGLHHGRPQPGLHAPLLSVSLPRAAGNACELPGRLDALPFSHLPGDPGPLSVRLTGLPAGRPAGLPVLAALLEHPLLEVDVRLVKTLWERN